MQITSGTTPAEITSPPDVILFEGKSTEYKDPGENIKGTDIFGLYYQLNYLDFKTVVDLTDHRNLWVGYYAISEGDPVEQDTASPDQSYTAGAFTDTCLPLWNSSHQFGLSLALTMLLALFY